MKLYTEEIYKLYMKWVDNIPDEKTIFTPKEIVNAISNIIESNPSLIELPSDEEIEKQTKDFMFEKNKEVFYNGAKWMKEQILNQNK